MTELATNTNTAAATIGTQSMDSPVIAMILAMTLFVVTRVEQPVVAALGMIFRLVEGALGEALDLTRITLSHPTVVGATLFAIGSTFFCWLLLRGRMLPRALARIGVI